MYIFEMMFVDNNIDFKNWDMVSNVNYYTVGVFS